jgi:ATP-binding cassette subfamily B protein
MGFFASLDVEAYDRQYTDRQLARRLFKYFKPQTKRLYLIAFFLAILACAGAAIPVVVSRTVDKLKGQVDMPTIAILCGTVFGLGMVYWVSNWARRRLTGRAIQDVMLDIRTAAFRAAVEHDLSFYDQFSSGRIVSRITSDTQEFGQVVNLITDLIYQVIESGLLGVTLVITAPRLMLYLVAFLPFVFLLALGFRGWARKVTRKGMRAMANVNAAIKETVSGIAVAKNFRQEQSIFSEFDNSNLVSYKTNLKRGFVLSLVFPSLNALAGLGTGWMLYVGGLEAANNIVTVGAWFLFLQSLDYFWFPILNLSAFWAQVQSGLSAAERAFALIDAESSVEQIDDKTVPRLKGEIRFEKVCFQYSTQEEVLHDFDLHIRPGENLALVGHTGAGKSSIAKLTARFYEFQEGKITVDGMDIRSLNLAQYRQQLGVVSQVPFLFSGSVIENIRYASPETSEAQIIKLAKEIGDGEWLDTLPQGLETQAGERGGRLSMGQRQLVSLMRVLVQEPAIFILDEATASIDPFTEWQIQQALNLILQNTTSILIAHRLSTVKAADRIIVLENGKIIEEGSHQSLLQQGGHYAELYNTYFRHQSLSYVEQSRNLEG